MVLTGEGVDEDLGAEDEHAGEEHHHIQADQGHANSQQCQEHSGDHEPDQRGLAGGVDIGDPAGNEQSDHSPDVEHHEEAE